MCVGGGEREEFLRFPSPDPHSLFSLVEFWPSKAEVHQKGPRKGQTRSSGRLRPCTAATKRPQSEQKSAKMARDGKNEIYPAEREGPAEGRVWRKAGSNTETQQQPTPTRETHTHNNRNQHHKTNMTNTKPSEHMHETTFDLKPISTSANVDFARFRPLVPRPALLRTPPQTTTVALAFPFDLGRAFSFVPRLTHISRLVRGARL